MDNWENWIDILNNSTRESQEYSAAIGGIRKALSDALDVGDEFISLNFIETKENLELIEKAA